MAPPTQQKEGTSNKKNQKKTKTAKKENETEDTDWHQIGNVEEVCAHKPEGLRKQLKQWEAEAEEMRYEGDAPTLLELFTYVLLARERILLQRCLFGASLCLLLRYPSFAVFVFFWFYLFLLPSFCCTVGAMLIGALLCVGSGWW